MWNVEILLPGTLAKPSSRSIPVTGTLVHPGPDSFDASPRLAKCNPPPGPVILPNTPTTRSSSSPPPSPRLHIWMSRPTRSRPLIEGLDCWVETGSHLLLCVVVRGAAHHAVRPLADHLVDGIPVGLAVRLEEVPHVLCGINHRRCRRSFRHPARAWRGFCHAGRRAWCRFLLHLDRELGGARVAVASLRSIYPWRCAWRQLLSQLIHFQRGAACWLGQCTGASPKCYCMYKG